MVHRTHEPFKRPCFDPRTQAGVSPTEDDIVSLPDLIRFNAKHNPDHVFCLQTETNNLQDAQDRSHGHYSANFITFKVLQEAVTSCAQWIAENILNPATEDHKSENKPIALFLESDIGLFLHLAALAILDVPILLISVRLSIPSVRHLLESTGAAALLVSPRTRRTIDESLSQWAVISTVQPYHIFLSDTCKELKKIQPPTLFWKHGTERAGSLILHSSGTTGYPKPIYLSHRYILGYAACHQFSPSQAIDWVNLSTLPLYHGFGLLAPCLSLSIGLTTCFPPSSIIPAAQSTFDLIRTFEAKSLMTVPSIIEDTFSLPSKEFESALVALRSLRFLAIGGGALNPEYGAELVKNKVNLLNHYGVTEIGAVAPIFCPGPDYNWRFLRLRTDLGLELRPIVDSKYFRLVGTPPGGSAPFEVQDQLERNMDSEHIEVRILGRTDDVLTLKTGEKVMPQKLESLLGRDPKINTAVCVGSGQFEVVVIIQLVDEETEDPVSMKDYIWELISKINPLLDRHAQVSSKQSIIIKPIGKKIPRSDKGSVMRREVVEVFSTEIDAAFAALELADNNDIGDLIDQYNAEVWITTAVDSIMGKNTGLSVIQKDDDFFELGMDSIQAVSLARSLSAALRKTQVCAGATPERLAPEFIYRNPSIRQLAAACSDILNDNVDVDAERSACSWLQDLVNESFDQLSSVAQRTAIVPTHNVVLLTGATGTIGTHTLAKLARDRSVKKVICPVRFPRGTSSTSRRGPNNDRFPLDRLHSSIDAQGIVLNATEWEKIQAIDIQLLMSTDDDHGEMNDLVSFSALANEVTHICHLSWPMDFNRSVHSFRPHIDFVLKLLDLAAQATLFQRRAQPVRMLFASTIAVLRYMGSSHVSIPESVVEDPSAVTPMGYAEAKWVCERILDQAGVALKRQVDPIVVRIGQISGPSDTNGIWNTNEHIPALVQASQKIGAFPTAHGNVSWLPADHAAWSLVDILFHREHVNRFVHLENPIRQPMQDIIAIMGTELGFSRPYTCPFDEWIKKASKIDAIGSLESFFKEHYAALAHGSIALDTTHCRSVSKTLRGESAVQKDLLLQYIRNWRREGFIS